MSVTPNKRYPLPVPAKTRVCRNAGPFFVSNLCTTVYQIIEWTVSAFNPTFASVLATLPITTARRKRRELFLFNLLELPALDPDSPGRHELLNSVRHCPHGYVKFHQQQALISLGDGLGL